MFSYFEPNFIENSFGKVFFSKFWPKSKWREIKICYLAAILKRYSIFIFYFIFFLNSIFYFIYLFIFFFAELWFFIVQTYMLQIPLQNSGGKVVFLRGQQREQKYLGHLSVNTAEIKFW